MDIALKLGITRIFERLKKRAASHGQRYQKLWASAPFRGVALLGLSLVLALGAYRTSQDHALNQWFASQRPKERDWNTLAQTVGLVRVSEPSTIYRIIRGLPARSESTVWVVSGQVLALETSEGLPILFCKVNSCQLENKPNWNPYKNSWSDFAAVRDALGVISGASQPLPAKRRQSVWRHPMEIRF